MSIPDANAEAARRFGVIARQFCAVVDSASSMDRAELLAGIYPILPKLIDEAIGLPDVELSIERSLLLADDASSFSIGTVLVSS